MILKFRFTFIIIGYIIADVFDSSLSKEYQCATQLYINIDKIQM